MRYGKLTRLLATLALPIFIDTLLVITLGAPLSLMRISAALSLSADGNPAAGPPNRWFNTPHWATTLIRKFCKYGDVAWADGEFGVAVA